MITPNQLEMAIHITEDYRSATVYERFPSKHLYFNCTLLIGVTNFSYGCGFEMVEKKKMHRRPICVSGFHFIARNEPTSGMMMIFPSVFFLSPETADSLPELKRSNFQ